MKIEEGRDEMKKFIEKVIQIFDELKREENKKPNRKELNKKPPENGGQEMRG